LTSSIFGEGVKGDTWQRNIMSSKIGFRAFSLSAWPRIVPPVTALLLLVLSIMFVGNTLETVSIPRLGRR